MLLTDFCSLDDIRAALGVSKDELEDATLSLEVYRSNLELELLDVDLTLVERYEPFIEAEVEDLQPVERRFVQAVRLFATYVVARHLTTALPLFSPKDITDGKASVSRYADSPYKGVIADIKAFCEKYRSWTVDALAALNSATATPEPVRSFMRVTAPARDPVTGI